MVPGDFRGWLGSVVQEARGRRGLTQAALAAAVGMPGRKVKVSQYETGQKPIPLARAAAFEEALALPAGFLAGAIQNFRERGGDPRHFRPWAEGPEGALTTAAARDYLEACVSAHLPAVARLLPDLWPSLSAP